MKREKNNNAVEKTGGKALIIEARFYTEIADKLADGAARVLEAAGMTVERASVPGCLEIPAALQFAAESGQYDAFVVLGCVVRGETRHFDIVCDESNRGVYAVTLANGLALGNGILTVDTMEQALERADVNQLDKGGDAARAAVTMLGLKRRWAA
ncbi:MAG: 6,7-dimethyl-8-ribityllumazine synthase [Proteobacteria bacterium]|nr:6,7-dimethyl-8-ribityllumazine synthase [Pseudomonadota bacterium]